MHIDNDIVLAIHEANLTANSTTETPEEILMNAETTTEDEIRSDTIDAFEVPDSTHNIQTDTTTAEILQVVVSCFPSGISNVLGGQASSMIKRAIRSWTWWEIRLRQATTPGQVAAAERGQENQAGLVANLVRFVGRSSIDVAQVIETELKRDPNKPRSDDEMLDLNCKVSGMTRAEVEAKIAGYAKDDGIDPKERTLRNSLAENHLPALRSRFLHDVSKGARELTIDELGQFIDWLYGRLVGNRERGFRGQIEQADRAWLVANEPNRKARLRADYLLLVNAAEVLAGQLEVVDRLRAERDAAGYEPMAVNIGVFH